MAQRLDGRDAAFPRAFADLLGAKREVSEDVDQVVRAIIEDVAARGDEALLAYPRRFDALDTTAERLRVSEEEIDAAIGECPRDALDALAFANMRG